jgi:hypothetical protein
VREAANQNGFAKQNNAAESKIISLPDPRQADCAWHFFIRGNLQLTAAAGCHFGDAVDDSIAGDPRA